VGDHVGKKYVGECRPVTSVENLSDLSDLVFLQVSIENLLSVKTAPLKSRMCLLFVCVYSCVFIFICCAMSFTLDVVEKFNMNCI